jgi:uncharacterized protein DUF3592
MATDGNNRVAAGCLMVFALPFAAVGVVALYFLGSTLLDWYAMRSWVAVPATLDRLELEEHQDEDSTTYEVAASYRYAYDGREYVNDRVAISGMADNLGSFQQKLYSALWLAQRNGSVTAFVDPRRPESATLNRDLRWLLLVFQGVFALVFGAVGFGLPLGARYGFKKLRAERERQQRFPDEPWRWKEEWAGGRIQGSNRATAYFAAGFATLWNLISLPAAIVVPREVAEGNTIALVALLFPAVGLGLAAWAVRAWRQLERFGVSTLVLQQMPVALGGRLRGAVRVEAEVPVESEFRISVTCTESRRVRRGRNSESDERLIWQDEWTVPRSACSITSTGTSIPVDVPLPADQPATSALDDNDRISWRLEVSGECPGPDYWNRFELPVFDIGEQSAAAPTPSTDDPPRSFGERPDRRRLEALGITYEQLARGEAWTFRRGQHKKVAAMLTLFSAVWTAITVGLFWSDAPVLLPIVFALFDAMFVWWALHLWFTEYRVTLDDRVLTLAKRGFTGGALVEIPRALVRGVRAQRGMQAGNKLYYDLKIETEEKVHTAASSLADYSVASWLADYWMRGTRSTQAA